MRERENPVRVTVFPTPVNPRATQHSKYPEEGLDAGRARWTRSEDVEGDESPKAVVISGK